MATFLDVTGLQHFSSIFVFLFVWIVVYAILSWTKVLGQNNFVSALVGLLMAIFVVMSPFATSIIASVAPFLAVIFVLVLLMSIATKMLGTEIESFPALKGILIVFIVLVIIIGVAVKIRTQADEQFSDKEPTGAMGLILNPKFTGIVLLFAIAIFTIALLAGGGAVGHGGHH